MNYLSTRGDATPRRFCEILLEGLAPDGGLYLPERYPQVDATLLARWRGLSYAELAFEILSLYIDDIPRRRSACADRPHVHRSRVRHARDHAAEAARRRHLPAGPVERTDARVQGHRDAVARPALRIRTRAARPNAQHPRAPRRAIPAARPSVRCAASAAVNVFMLSPHGRMSAFQQAQMFSLQDANIHNIAIEGVFDDCQDIVKAVSADLEFKRAHRIGTVQLDQLGAVAGAGGLLLRGVFPGDALRGSLRQAQGDRAERLGPIGTGGRLRRALGQLRQHLCGPRRAFDGLADPPSRARDEREQRARRVLPHRHLSRARGCRDVRDVEPVDGHLEGLELRALHLRSGRPRRGAHARAVPAGTRQARRLHAARRRVRAYPVLRIRLRCQHACRPARDDPRYPPNAAASSSIRTPPMA